MLVESITHNYIFYLSVLACAFTIAKFSKSSFILAVVSLVYVSFIGYVSHAFVHNFNYTNALKENSGHPLLVKYPKLVPYLEKLCYYMDFHEETHHDTTINRQIPNLLTEFVLNFLTQGGLFMLVILFCRYVNIYIVLLWALAYCTVHNINYDYIRPAAHQYHHQNKHTNYGIDVWDVLFQTKHPEDKTVEDINHYSINMIISTAIICLFLSELEKKD